MLLRYLIEATMHEVLTIQTELIELLPESIDISIQSEDLTSTYKRIWLRASKGTREIDIKLVTGNRVFTLMRNYEVGDGSALVAVSTVKNLAEVILDELEGQ